MNIPLELWAFVLGLLLGLFVAIFVVFIYHTQYKWYTGVTKTLLNRQHNLITNYEVPILQQPEPTHFGSRSDEAESQLENFRESLKDPEVRAQMAQSLMSEDYNEE